MTIIENLHKVMSKKCMWVDVSGRFSFYAFLTEDLNCLMYSIKQRARIKLMGMVCGI